MTLIDACFELLARLQNNGFKDMDDTPGCFVWVTSHRVVQQYRLAHEQTHAGFIDLKIANLRVLTLDRITDDSVRLGYYSGVLTRDFDAQRLRGIQRTVAEIAVLSVPDGADAREWVSPQWGAAAVPSPPVELARRDVAVAMSVHEFVPGVADDLWRDLPASFSYGDILTKPPLVNTGLTLTGRDRTCSAPPAAPPHGGGFFVAYPEPLSAASVVRAYAVTPLPYVPPEGEW